MVSPPRGLVGLILAGGQGRRLGGIDKGLADWMGRPLVEWAIEALRDQVDSILISANRHPEVYARYGCPVLHDRLPGFQGPLAGIASALREVRCGWVLCVPCDSPCTPRDLGKRLAEGLTAAGAEIAVASDGTRLQPLHALIPAALEASLEAYLARGERAVLGWYAEHRMARVVLPQGPEAFANLNTQADGRRLADALGAGSASLAAVAATDGRGGIGPVAGPALPGDDREPS